MGQGVGWSKGWGLAWAMGASPVSYRHNFVVGIVMKGKTDLTAEL